jgi:acyl-CoA oxidase
LLQTYTKEAVDRRNAAFQRVEKAPGTDDNSKLPPIYGVMNCQELLLEGLRAGKIIFEDGFDYDCDTFDYVSYLVVFKSSWPYPYSLYPIREFAGHG